MTFTLPITAARRPSDLVELIALEPGIRVDLRYARADNFLGRPVYPSDARVYLQREVAEAVVRVHRGLAAGGHGLLVFDGYRPWSVSRVLWEETGEEAHPYLAHPARGSRHNRGCAVDLSLAGLADGTEVAMPSGFDEFTERAHADYAGGDETVRERRELLRAAMEAEGFTVNPREWWHFDHETWEDYPVLDLSFAELPASAG